MEASDKPLGSYSLYYFWYFAALGVFNPYLAVWATHAGIGALALAALATILRLTNVIAPIVWGPRAMLAKNPAHWLFSGTVLAALSVWMFSRTTDGFLLGALMLMFGMFFSAILPQAESMTMAALGPGRGGHRYGKIRMWGSLGALIMNLVAGVVLLQWDHRWYPVMCAICLAIAALACLPNMNKKVLGPAPPRASNVKWRALLANKHVVWIMGTTLLMNVGFSGYYLFFALMMENQGFSGLVVGALLALATGFEMWAFLRISWFFDRFSPRSLIALSLAVTVVRWTILAFFPASIVMVGISQLGHAFSFAVFHGSCMRIVSEQFPGRRGGVGMGLLNSVGFGIGGAVGALLMGVLWEFTGPSAMFMAAAVITAVALFWTLSRPDRDTHAPALSESSPDREMSNLPVA